MAAAKAAKSAKALTAAVGTAVPARRARSFRPPRAVPVVALVAGVAVAAVVIAAVIAYDGSLHVGGAGLVACRAAEALVVLASLSVPVCGGLAVRALLRSRRHARAGDLPAARIAADDVKQWAWYVLGLGLTGAIVAFLFAFFGANDGKVRTVLFNWHYPLDHANDLARGFWLNVKLFVVAEVIVLVWALVVALVRLIPGRAGAPMRWLAIVYTDLFRGVPALLVLFIVVFGFPLAGLPFVSDLGRDSQRFWLAVLALVLAYGAYVSEVYRAGLESIHWSQTAAARSLGLSHLQTLRHVIVPQAVRRIIPPLLNDFISLQKDTSLVAFVGLLDIVNTANILKGQFFNLSFGAGAALAFLVVTIPLTRLTDFLVKRDQRRMRALGT